MSDYKLTTGTSITRTSDGAAIPADPRNMDYQQYLTWVAIGNTPDPAQTVAQAQTARLSMFDAAAAAAYTAGFESAASGAPLWYDSDSDTQAVINRQYLIALSSPTIYSATTFFNGAPAGVTPMRARPTATSPDSAKTVQYLNAAQMVQLGNDLAATWESVKLQLWTLQAQVNAATTTAAVEAITWV